MSVKQTTLIYHTRDGKGNDIVKNVELKDFDLTGIDFTCKICNLEQTKGVPIKKVVSSHFTDWQYIGDYVCESCAKKFALYKYSYIIQGDNIKLLNVREAAEEIKQEHTPPFMFVISKSQKKHLFYKAVTNMDSKRFIVNLEKEQIAVELDSLRRDFILIESLVTLGESKQRLSHAMVSNDTIKLLGLDRYRMLLEKLNTRQMQIPLFLAQKKETKDEEALCYVDSILKA